MRRLLSRSAPLAAALLLSACGADISDGTQLLGQRCFQDSECGEGLVCRERVCIPAGGSITPDLDMSIDPDQPVDPDMIVNPDMPRPDMSGMDMPPPPDMSRPDMPPPPDMPPACMVGEQRCVNERVFEICVNQPGSPAPQFVRRGCPQGELCEDGKCQPQCFDRDGDGFPGNCAPFDCDDNDPRTNPRAQERCGDMRDNNCNMRVDEGCEQCCPDGCGPNEFCNECACQPFDPAICQAQGQPCFNQDSFENGYYCGDLTGSGQLRCIGLCGQLQGGGFEQCPDPNTSCSFVDPETGVGTCWTGCAVGGTCSDPSLSCIPIEGANTGASCFPGNPNNPIGAPCDQNSFFDCQDSAVCIDLSLQGAGATCQRACRPFALPGVQTDCGMGQHCLPLSPEIGVCRQDVTSREGQPCNQPAATCGEDGVFCQQNNQGAFTCQRVCREGNNGDCLANQRCAPSMDGSGTGVCVRRAP